MRAINRGRDEQPFSRYLCPSVSLFLLVNASLATLFLPAQKERARVYMFEREGETESKEECGCGLLHRMH